VERDNRYYRGDNEKRCGLGENNFICDSYACRVSFFIVAFKIYMKNNFILKIIVAAMLLVSLVLWLGCAHLSAVEPPTGLVATAKSDEDASRWVLLNWNASTTPSVTYNIYMATWPNAPIEDADLVDAFDPETTHNVDAIFSSLPTYYFRATAMDGDLNESIPSNESSIKFPVLSVPADTKAIAWPNIVKVQWTATFADVRGGVDGYFLYRSVDNINYTKISDIGWILPTDEDPYMIEEDTDVVNGTRYYYKLKSYYGYPTIEESGFTSFVSTIPFADSPPRTYISQPISSQTLVGTGQYTIKGTATDDKSVYSVSVVIAISGGLYWGGTTWTVTPTAVQSTQDSSGTLVNWQYTFSLPISSWISPGIIYAWAEDNYEQYDETGTYVTFYVSNSGELPPIVPITTDISTDAFDIIVFPNPAPTKSTVTLAYTITEAANVDIKIYNRIGELIKKVVSEKMQAGVYGEYLALKNTAGSDIASGVYYVVAKMNNKKKIFKLKIND